jgi:hypothetical protein
MIDKITMPKVLWSILKLWREEQGTWPNDSLRKSSEETISAVAEAGKNTSTAAWPTRFPQTLFGPGQIQSSMSSPNF